MLWNMKFSNQYNHISYTKIWIWNWVNTLKPKWTPFRRRHLQVHFSMKIFEFRLTFQWGLFSRVQLTIFQHICVIRPQSVKRCLSNDYSCIPVFVCVEVGACMCVHAHTDICYWWKRRLCSEQVKCYLLFMDLMVEMIQMSRFSTLPNEYLGYIFPVIGNTLQPLSWIYDLITGNGYVVDY